MKDNSRDQEAVRSLFLKPEFEMLPFSSAIDQIDFLPEAATVTITASPAKGIEATLEYATKLAQRGFDVVPHIAARSIADGAHLSRILDTIADADIGRIFVVGGDSTDAGDFPDGLSLIQAIESLDYPLPEIGVAAYPDGHPFISYEALRQALKDKQPYASYMTTQMCFNPVIISNWIADVRSDGITLPIHLGMPGVGSIPKLISIAAKIGVGDSARFLSRHRGLLGRLTRQSTYSPDRLAMGLSQVIADPTADIEVVHLYTFNQVESSEAWRQDWLEAIDG
ncbi:MAG: methylenetetrahydrofolate reductase [Actinobacteria bacterium]|nr:methylenetetrahydrofolate reductase [Actinomycetota bacterium]